MSSSTYSQHKFNLLVKDTQSLIQVFKAETREAAVQIKPIDKFLDFFKNNKRKANQITTATRTMGLLKQ